MDVTDFASVINMVDIIEIIISYKRDTFCKNKCINKQLVVLID